MIRPRLTTTTSLSGSWTMLLVLVLPIPSLAVVLFDDRCHKTVPWQSSRRIETVPSLFFLYPSCLHFLPFRLVGDVGLAVGVHVGAVPVVFVAEEASDELEGEAGGLSLFVFCRDHF